jgi:hypothetical protein
VNPDNGLGPPKEVDPDASQGVKADQQVSHDTTTNAHNTDSSPREPGNTLVWVPCTRSYPQDLRAQLSRRRQAAARSVPLDCRCRDPLGCRCSEPPLSERAIESWRDSALHVLRTGYMPVLPIEARRALWKRGGADRLLAELLHDACGGEAA